MKFKIKKGDVVQVIAGNGRGLTGRVLRVDKEKLRVELDSDSKYLTKRVHEKPNPQNQQGGIVQKARAIHYSNVMVVDSDGEPTRIGIKEVEKGGRKEKVRFAKSNGKDIN
jgi:large subunit ribosomal protein L24